MKPSELAELFCDELELPRDDMDVREWMTEHITAAEREAWEAGFVAGRSKRRYGDASEEWRRDRETE